jgi:hypothetical protein
METMHCSAKQGIKKIPKAYGYPLGKESLCSEKEIVHTLHSSGHHLRGGRPRSAGDE